MAVDYLQSSCGGGGCLGSFVSLGPQVIYGRIWFGTGLLHRSFRRQFLAGISNGVVKEKLRGMFIVLSILSLPLKAESWLEQLASICLLIDRRLVITDGLESRTFSVT